MTAERVAFRGDVGHFWAVLLATAIADVKRINAYLIDVIRWPLFPLMLYATWQISYRVSGQERIAGADVAGFLLVGMVGLIIWSTTIWSGGYAIEMERSAGTVAALFVSPASRVAVVLGYGLGGLLWAVPALAVVALLGLVTGARLSVADPLALAAAVAALVVAALASGFALAGLFVLSRRANLLANFLQMPIYLLAGFVVPRENLPWLLRLLSNALPVSHAVDALRASALGAASLGAVGPAVGLALLTSLALAVVGGIALRKVERMVKHAGELELH